MQTSLTLPQRFQDYALSYVPNVLTDVRRNIVVGLAFLRIKIILNLINLVLKVTFPKIPTISLENYKQIRHSYDKIHPLAEALRGLQSDFWKTLSPFLAKDITILQNLILKQDRQLEEALLKLAPRPAPSKGFFKAVSEQDIWQRRCKAYKHLI